MMNRRQAIKTTLVTTALIAGARSLPVAGADSAGSTAQASSGPFVLPPLTYAYDALEPIIDAQTMQIHHDKHHAAYVNNLNKAISSHAELGQKPVEDLIRDLNSIPEDVRLAVRNQGGGHANHSFFWRILSKNGGRPPKDKLRSAMEKQFGGFSGFQEQFAKAATSLFGSGWAWLTIDANQQLRVESTSNQDSPLSAGRIPLLTIDVWEHAYYLKYQNRRPDYVAAFQQVINWDYVTELHAKATA